MMKLMIVFLTILNTFSLFATLDVNKTIEAMLKAQFQQNECHFVYTLFDGPTKQIVIENDPCPNQKGYGPYHLTLTGIKPGTRFDLYSFNLLRTQNPTFKGYGYIDKHGEAWIKKKECTVKLSNCVDHFDGVLPGEPMFAMIVLRDKKTYIAACVFPNPLEAHGKEKRHVSMRLWSLDEPIYIVHGENFEPEEEITMLIHSKNNTRIEKLEAKDGTFITMIEADCSKGELEPESIQIFTAAQMKPMTIAYDWEWWNFLEKVMPRNACNTQ